MKKEYNRNVTSDMPMDASFNPSVEKPKLKTAAKPKINAIGKKATSATSKKPATKPKTNTVEAKSAKTEKVKNGTAAKKLSDLEKLNDESLKTYRYKSRRNRIVIILLSVMLALTIATLSVFLVMSRLETNCYMIAHGASATFFVDGEEMDNFRAPANLQGNSILTFDAQVRLDSSGTYQVRFVILCYQNGEKLNNTLVYLPNYDMFYEDEDGYYCSNRTISGGQTVLLCKGAILDYEYRNSLNSDNFRLDLHVYFKEV